MSPFFQSILRRHAALSIGEIILIDSAEGVLAFERQHDDERLLIALNLSDQTQRLLLAKKHVVARVLCSTVTLPPLDGTLAPNEGLILQLNEQD